MTRFLKRHLPVVAAIAILILGGAVAALASTGAGVQPTASHHRARAHSPRGRRLLESAAAYIGIPVETLEADLRSGKSLAQIATEAGKTEAGLVQALATTARAGLEERLAQAVKQPGGLHGEHAQGRRLRNAAAIYLAIKPSVLNSDLRSGKTLAQVAESTPGRSKQGLINALLLARRAGSSGRGSGLKAPGKNTAKARSTRLRERVTAFVEHSHAARSQQKSSSGG